MLPTGFFAVLISIGLLMLLCVVSMREPARKRRARDDGAILPLWMPDDLSD
ncbi:MAG: hypothetical protein J0L81_12170 [Caulobacterales bacterium]|jgi:hypothetical protein|nr:hypothetical protein [Caulobacterales bacterium]